MNHNSYILFAAAFMMLVAFIVESLVGDTLAEHHIQPSDLEWLPLLFGAVIAAGITLLVVRHTGYVDWCEGLNRRITDDAWYYRPWASSLWLFLLLFMVCYTLVNNAYRLVPNTVTMQVYHAQILRNASLAVPEIADTLSLPMRTTKRNTQVIEKDSWGYKLWLAFAMPRYVNDAEKLAYAEQHSAMLQQAALLDGGDRYFNPTLDTSRTFAVLQALFRLNSYGQLMVNHVSKDVYMTYYYPRLIEFFLNNGLQVKVTLPNGQKRTLKEQLVREHFERYPATDAVVREINGQLYQAFNKDVIQNYSILMLIHFSNKERYDSLGDMLDYHHTNQEFERDGLTYENLRALVHHVVDDNAHYTLMSELADDVFPLDSGNFYANALAYKADDADYSLATFVLSDTFADLNARNGGVFAIDTRLLADTLRYLNRPVRGWRGNGWNIGSAAIVYPPFRNYVTQLKPSQLDPKSTEFLNRYLTVPYGGLAALSLVVLLLLPGLLVSLIKIGQPSRHVRR